MAIITLSDALIQRLASDDRRILRDRVLSGFCLRLNKRTRTFMIATTVCGRQVRVTLGRWPLISTAEARALAAELLLDCRKGVVPASPIAPVVVTLRMILPKYAQAKGLKASSLRRYESLLKTHFDEWEDRPLTAMATAEFSNFCHNFAQTRGKAIVEVGRGLIGAILKYVNAVHGLNLVSPFTQLAAAGLMPERSQPRARSLQEAGLPAWYKAVRGLKDKQRDLLMLLAMTGLRRNEGGMLQVSHVDVKAGTIHIPDTKTGQAHSLPITPVLLELLERRMHGLKENEYLFGGVALEHVADMAIRAGAPKFMLHDLRKMLATTGELMGFSDAVMRRILNHKAQRSDTLHRHYVSLSSEDVRQPLISIQGQLLKSMQSFSTK